MESISLFTFVEAAAVVVSSVSGMIKAAEKKMDLVGAYSLALLVSFGGGTLRDVLLNRRPFFWIENEVYLFVVLFVAIAFVYVPVFHKIAKLLHTRSNTVEATGLGLFSIAGLFAALNMGMPLFSASLMGVITGVAGGVFRDVVTNEIPVIFRYTGGLYAVASFVGCWVCIAFMFLLDAAFTGFIAGAASIVALRLMSVYFGVQLPRPLWVKDEE
ncbi:MAG: trimeric intracellular cation channel family protein [Bacteroidia bacterium]|nr:trimeric intracellular cation channel family protein [Bacteroidia bacterium]